MARLKQPPPLLARAPNRIAEPTRAEQQAHRDSAPWRKLYNTKEWRRLRWSILIRDRFTCRMCGRLEGKTALLVCDHIRPHRGNLALFWDPTNLQTLCKSPCHDQHKQAQEQGSKGQVGVWD